jgi:menaquinone-dependent protoporphyrinogen oxidase
MKPILIVYATREGHTRRVAEHIVEAMHHRGLQAELHDARTIDQPVDLSRFSAAILGGSLHLGRHEKELVKFIQRERPQLERLPTAFLSVSLAEAGAEDETLTPERRALAAKGVAERMDALFAETGWHPDRAKPVAGALMYSKYNLLVRWVMKRIAKSYGASTDTAHDRVYTDWEALDRFVDDFVGGIEELPRAAGA